MLLALRAPLFVRFTMPVPPKPMIAPLLVAFREPVPSTLTIPVVPLFDPAIRAASKSDLACA